MPPILPSVSLLIICNHIQIIDANKRQHRTQHNLTKQSQKFSLAIQKTQSSTIHLCLLPSRQLLISCAKLFQFPWALIFWPSLICGIVPKAVLNQCRLCQSQLVSCSNINSINWTEPPSTSYMLTDAHILSNQMKINPTPDYPPPII